MGDLEPGRGDRRDTTTFAVFAVLLTLLAVAASYVPNTWINRDGRFYTNVNVTLTESLSLDQSEFCASWYEGQEDQEHQEHPRRWNYDVDAAWSNVAVGRGDARLPKHPVLMPVLATPLFWAFGMHGTLIFNIAAFAFAAAAVFLFTRRYASRAAATLAALAFFFGTSVGGYAYDYHVDVLLLALFASGVAALHGRSGGLAGLLIGGAVMLKPTTLLFVPSLVLLGSTRERWPTLRRSLLTGAGALVVLGLFNWWLFGRPWWSGYNRTLVVVAGVPQIVDVASAFDVPFGDGIEALWSGAKGVRSRLPVMLAAVPGLLWMGRRRWRYVLAVALSLGLAVAVFSRYEWYDDRFLWPAFALLTPGLAATLDLAHRALRTAFTMRPALGPSTVVALGAMLLVGVGAVGASDAERSDEPSPTHLGAAALTRGTFDLRDVTGVGALSPVMDGPDSMVSVTRQGTWVARVSPIATLVAAPFAWGGHRGFALLHVLLAGWLAFGCARLAERIAPGPIALAAPLALLLVPGVGPRLAAGGPELFTATFVVNGLALAAYGRWRSAGLVSALAAGTALAPLPMALVVLVLAPKGRPRMHAAAGIAAVALPAMALAAWLWGSPFGTAHDAVLFAGAVQGVPVEAAPLQATWAALTRGPGLAWLGLLVIGFLGSGPSRVGRLAALCMLAALWPSARATAEVPLFVLALGALGWPEAVRRLGRGVDTMAGLSVGRWTQVVGAALIALFIVGAGARVAAAGAPITLASYRGLRRAEVFLASTRCDFLNWQHMNWECATLDHGALNMVGLQATDGVWVDGKRRALLRIPNTEDANRRVRWPGLAATGRFQLTWAVPDDAAGPRRGPATLVVRIEGEEAARFDLPPETSSHVETLPISNAAHAGRPVAVELELLGPGAVVAVDGEFLE